ncbi:MAG TPA: N-acetylmuramoyl-L-alanine amidase [Chitinophagaceae bacterium]
MLRTLMLCGCMSSLAAFAQDSSEQVILARSTNPLTMLAYGLGEDRLGGAKMGYVDTPVLFRIIDSTGNLYKVQLSANRTAYVGKRDLQPDTSSAEKPFYLLKSWSLRGSEDRRDILSLAIDEKLPYKSWMEINPSRIVLEIFGVQSNTNWITQLQSAKEVDNVYMNQVEDDVVRITIELRHRQHWGYSLRYRGKSLVLSVNQPPAKLNLRKLKIAVDAGHGGTNRGASGVKTNIQEKEYTLLFAEALRKKLRCKGAEVIMTRTSDTTIDNQQRVLKLMEQQPVLLISLHLNSSSNPQISGVSTYYKHIGFRPLSVEILDEMLDLQLKEFGNIGNFNFMLNAPTEFPNCLVEIAFLSNESDEQLVLSSKFRKATAKKITRGIRNFLRQAD